MNVVVRLIILLMLFLTSQSGVAATTKFTVHQYDVNHIALSEEIYGYDTNSNPQHCCQIPLAVNTQDRSFLAFVSDFLTTKRVGSQGVVAGRHNANVTVKDSKGNIVSHKRIVSGNMTPAEKALGFPKNTLASHTEARAVTHTSLKSGQSMTITGQKPPCPSCKGYMNKAAGKTGATIRYQWRENGQTLRWNATPKIIR